MIMKVGRKDSLLRLLGGELAEALDLILRDTDSHGVWISGESTQTSIMKKLGVSRPTYFRYVKKLVDSGILIKYPEKGRGVYYINGELLRPAKWSQ